MHSRLLFLIILSFFTFQLYAIPTNYFISPTGNDANNGLTSTTPKATLANVFSFNLGAGDTIFVAAGTYSEKGIVVGNNDEGFVIQGAALDAAGVPTSIFDSDQTDRWLIFGFDKSDNISFRNIMIKNYKGKGSFSGSGGAICINGKDCINLSISNCIFDNCDSELNGGAIFFNYLSSRNSTWNINNCIFKNCTSSFKGGAIYLSSGDDLDVNISKCVFYSNSTDNDYGSAIWYDGATGSLLTMTNCLLYNNSIGGAGNYGVIYVHNNPIANIVNCTITNNNSLATSVGGVFFNGGGSTLTNCIVYGNTTKDVYRASGTINLKYCCYKTHQGCSPSNSFTTDPGFKSPGTNDYSLATGSGCIDKGTASGAPNDDILSAPRPMGLGYDVGAYESSPCSVNAASSTPTVCINSPLTNITHTTTGATGIINDGVLAANGLPAGLKAIFTGNATAGTITISGTPTADGTFTYSIPLTVGCGSVNATGTIKVDKASVGGSLSADQKLCLGTSATDISMINAVGKIQWQKSTNNILFTDITGATGATLTSATIGTLTDTAYFRAVVTSGVCSSTNSPSVKIAVYPTPKTPVLDKTKVYCKSDISLNLTNIKFTSPALASSQQYFVFYKAGLPILPELLNNANGNYQVAFFDGECLGDKLNFKFPTDIQLNPGPTLTNPLSDVVMCQNEKPDLARVESKASLPAGTVSWYATSNDLNPIIKSTKVTNTNTTYYLSIMDNVTNCMNETRFPIVVKLNSGENIQLNPLFGLCSNTSYTVAYLDKSVTNDLSKGSIKWYNDNILPIVGQSLSKNDKVDFTKSYYAVYVPTNTQLCSSDIKELLPMNLVTVTVNPILPLSQTNQGFCYEPVRFVSDLNFLPYNSSEIQVFSEASNSNAKLDLVEKLISAPYYIKTKKVLINTTCYSDNFTTINVNVNKPALETETHFSNCGKKNGYIKLTSYPNNAIITWYKDNILLSDNSDVLKGLDKGEFKIVINDNGCVRSKKVELNDCVPSEIPHIITPNNDSKNDLWVLGYYEKYPNVSVQIMNRWGNKVFESDKPYKDNWDGKNMNGEFLPTGTYFYLIDKGNGEQVISGFVEFVK